MTAPGTDSIGDRMQRVHNVSHDLAKLGLDLLANVHSPGDLALGKVYAERIRRAVASLDVVIGEAELLRASLEARKS